MSSYINHSWHLSAGGIHSSEGMREKASTTVSVLNFGQERLLVPFMSLVWHNDILGIKPELPAHEADTPPLIYLGDKYSVEWNKNNINISSKVADLQCNLKLDSKESLLA